MSSNFKFSTGHTPLPSGIAQEDTSHQAISSYFIGPEAENLQYFRQNISTILDELELTRKNYFPEDGPFITGKIQNSNTFQKKTKGFANAVQKAANLLGKHSLPFWSPRYEAHMCMDLSMPALLGYFMTTLYNPNNVAIEASPLTTVAEIQAGEQLCELFGYNIDPARTDVPTGWGHVTCGGTVANLESIWVARNLKFYPLSLRLALEKDKAFAFIGDEFEVETCVGDLKSFKKLSNWELLNLKPNTVLDLPDRLYEEYGISASYLSTALNDYNIQTTGKDYLERTFNLDIDKPSVYMLANTRHYSWPKGGAVAGIGSGNVIGIDVDDGARVDLHKLEEQLELALSKEQAVYAVVAIIGSTEEGAVDPLSSILQMRKRYQARGLSFLVHGDAAWGGYFCSMLPKDYKPGDVASVPNGVNGGGDEGFVPDFALRAQTQEDLFALRYADSITVDPHKAGYIPYPAGGLCYKDGRMRYLVTWTSPYLSRGAVTSIGIYGVEGSKPGAAAMSTWLSNKAIGLGQDGYGALLNEVTFTCTRIAAEWSAMTTPDMNYSVVPFNLLPSETKPNATQQSIEAEKQRIRNEILGKTNSEIAASDKAEQTYALLRDLGSDLNINAFAVNFRYPDGKLNDDVEEANYLMTRVVETLSVDSPGDDPTKVPLFLTSTEFSPELYGECANTFKRRLGLKESNHDLMVMRNVVMSPFPTTGNFIQKITDEFKKVVSEEVKTCVERNTLRPDNFSFLIQGTDPTYLVHLAKFHVGNHRQQFILNVKLHEDIIQQIFDLRNANPDETFILTTTRKVLMPELLNSAGTGATFQAKVESVTSGTLIKYVNVEVLSVVKSRPLNAVNRDDDYPSLPDIGLPFYLYGKPETQDYHIDHVLTRAPNIQLSADKVKLEVGSGASGLDEAVQNGAILTLDNISERAMQPFPPTAELSLSKAASSASGSKLTNGAVNGYGGSANGTGVGPAKTGFFFRPGASFDVSVYKDAKDAQAVGPGLLDVAKDPANKVGSGKLTLSGRVFVDSDGVNKDPYKRTDAMPDWINEFNEIGKELE